VSDAKTDLLAIGEAYAELDFVVRQLDDGSLTVAVDDSLPDEQRVRIQATDGGLKASLIVTSANAGDGMPQALERLSSSVSGGQVCWHEGGVYREITLPWEGKFPESKLRSLFEGVDADVKRLRPDITKAAQGEMSWSDVASSPAPPADRNAKAKAMRLAGAGLGYEPQELEARSEKPLMPPSFLPGTGQASEEDRATLRYGAVGDVPGRSELSAADRSDSFRVERPVQPGGQTPFAVIGVLAFLGLFALAGVFMKLTEEKETPPSETPVATIPVNTGGEDGGEDGDEDGDDGGGGSMFDPGLPPTNDFGSDSSGTDSSDRDSSETRVPAGLGTEEGVLRVAGEPDAIARRRAVEHWLEFKMDRGSGARLRMLQALDRRIEHEVGLTLLKSFRERPVGVEEALECLDLANEGIRRLLIEQLANGAHAVEDAEVIAEMLAEIPDGEDMLIERSLIRLGFPKPGAAMRMIKKRGVIWVQLGEGNELVRNMIAKDLKQAKSLAKYPDEIVRALVCDFLAKTDDPKALGYVTPLLVDSSAKVRRRAIECMASLQSGKASWPLARQLVVEKDNRTAELIRAAISKLPAEETAKYLRALLKKKKTSDRMAAVKALRAMGRTEAVPILLRALRDPKENVQLEAVDALRRIHKQPLLANSVSQGVSEIRRAALSKASPKKVKKAARQLHYQVTGRFP
jgi:hypothetical protein